MKHAEILIKQLPMAYAYHKLIFDDNHVAVDYVFLDANLAFEKMTGLPVDSIIGKKITQVLPDIRGGAFDWIACYAEVVSSGTTKEFSQFDDNLQKWYKVTAFSPEKDYFVTVFQDISKEVENIKQLEKQKEDIGELCRRFQSMFRDHSAIMCIIDSDTKQILEVNPAAADFFGFSIEETQSMWVYDVCLLPAEKLEMNHQMILNRQIKSFMAAYRKKNGDVHLMEVLSSPIHYNERTCLYSILFDVTDRENFREELQRERDLLSITLSSIGEGVITTDRNGIVTSVNKSAQKITGWQEQDTVGGLFTDFFRLQREDTGEAMEAPITQLLNGGERSFLSNETVMISKQGVGIPIANSVSPIIDKYGNIFGMVMVFRDVSKEKEHENQVLYLSYHDALTGLYNRRFVEEEIARLDTKRQLPLSVIIGDVNGLKITNDIFGHDAGDKLLRKISETIRECCRKEDIIARWGGDEILILLPGTPLEYTRLLENRIQESLAKKSEGLLHLSISLGYAVKQKETDDIHQILRLAEERMYRQKLSDGKEYRETIIDIMLSLLYQRNSDMKERGERVKAHCMRMGKLLGLSEKALHELSSFAELQDIGQIGIREELLKKPVLTMEEREELKQLPLIGYRIALNTPKFVPIAEYILSRYEHWDGSGYPRGAKGKDIPLPVRILAVADAYDTMTSRFACGKSIEEAFARLREDAGLKFDPDIVELFIKTISAMDN